MGQCPRPLRRSDPAAWARVVSTVKKRVLAAHFQALECMARARERQIPKLYINCGSSSRSSDRSEKVCVGRLRARPPLRVVCVRFEGASGGKRKQRGVWRSASPVALCAM